MPSEIARSMVNALWTLRSNDRFGSKADMSVHDPMSALPPKADICSAITDVCFGPKADSCSVIGCVRFGPIADICVWSHVSVMRDFHAAVFEGRLWGTFLYAISCSN